MLEWEHYLRWRDAFASIMDTHFYTIEWLDGEVSSGRAQFIASPDAAIVCELRPYPAGAVDVHGLIAAGNLETIVGDLIPRAEEWGRSLGATGAVIESREGWVKALVGRGYGPYQTAVRKDF